MNYNNNLKEENFDIISKLQIELAKNQSPVLTYEGKYFSSRYNPESEAENLVKGIPPCSFVVYSGIGNFYPILLLIKRKCKIILYIPQKCILDYLHQNQLLNEIHNYNNIVITHSLPDLSLKIKQFYFPGRDGKFNFIESRSDKNLFFDNYKNVTTVIEKTLSEIKIDYSVQAHFGKIWTRNIIQNLSLISQKRFSLNINQENKNGCIVTAAGPNLNNEIYNAKEMIKKFTIIATDTSLPVLLKNNIKPDFLITIDPQIHSLNHIIYKLPKETIVIADLCANTSLIRNVIKNGNPVLISKGKHPIGNLAEESGAKNFLNLENGTGSVTITAISFADFLGWREIVLWGGDFANTHFSPYCRGTYLSEIFDSNSTRNSNSETQYTQILFRSPVTLDMDKETYNSEILKSYAESCLQYTNSRNIRLIRDIKESKVAKNKQPINTLESVFLPDNFFYNMNMFLSKKELSSNEFLPLTAWIKNKKNSKNSLSNPKCLTEKYIKYFI